MSKQDEEKTVIDLTGMYRDSFKDCAVKDCKDIEEFLEKYHIDDHKKCLQQGHSCSKEGYFLALEYVHQMDFDSKGYTVIFKNESKDGKKVSLFKEDC